MKQMEYNVDYNVPFGTKITDPDLSSSSISPTLDLFHHKINVVDSGSQIIMFDGFLSEQDQSRNKQGMMVTKMTAEVAMMELLSNALLTLPTLEKC